MRQTPNQIKKEEGQMFLALVLIILVLMMNSRKRQSLNSCFIVAMPQN